MSLNLGNGGLAALMENPDEVKKAICGTPNYIAPRGTLRISIPPHIFEMGTWSYTWSLSGIL
ncbi:hypothetical protein M413DRAFT_448758 [Hebeloma cylindrosporum]|uniref:Protein kinase domain-containing protein n=1 Tax=Hebeloma cylindrosporum TaxID=76867 RepID=A0A0C2XGL5_HEBCY|nr:hypothetical protein M413DRAFT_448758 [Hebeloma cylindrosporum h7]